MSRDNSTHVRITAATRERLLALARSLEQSSEKGHIDDCRDQIDSTRPGANAVSMDMAIRVLLDQRDAHHGRAASARAKKKARKQGAKKSGTTGQEE